MSAPDPKVVGLLAEHAPTYTERATDPSATFYCKPCSEAAGDWVTWTPEHVAQVLADAGIGDVAAAEIAGQMKHITAEMVRGDQPLAEKEELIADLRARLSHAEAEAHNLEADYDRRGERLWRLAAKAGHVPHESDNDATAELAVTQALAEADARVAAVVEPVRALADEIATAGVTCECGHYVGGEHNGRGCYAVVTYSPLVRCSCTKTDAQDEDEIVAARIRAAIESTDAAAALARVRAEALREAARAGRGFLGDEGHSSSAWDYLDMTADRIEAERKAGIR